MVRGGRCLNYLESGMFGIEIDHFKVIPAPIILMILEKMTANKNKKKPAIQWRASCMYQDMEILHKSSTGSDFTP